jgi:hypothetical protein
MSSPVHKHCCIKCIIDCAYDCIEGSVHFQQPDSNHSIYVSGISVATLAVIIITHTHCFRSLLSLLSGWRLSVIRKDKFISSLNPLDNHLLSTRILFNRFGPVLCVLKVQVCCTCSNLVSLNGVPLSAAWALQDVHTSRTVMEPSPLCCWVPVRWKTVHSLWS